jgi:hypothetical protein
MDDKTVSTTETTNSSSGTENTADSQNEQTTAPVSSPAIEHRQSYGTAKTENLRDSGLWRVILPAFVVVCCLVLFAIPLIILVPLLGASLDPLSASRVAHDNLTWIWITLIVLSVGIATIIVRGLSKIFLTQAGNYHKV